jgi:hypothetical protein
MEQAFHWIAEQGRWAEYALVGVMILVSLVALKLAVSVAARMVVLLVTIGLVGGGLYCLHRVRKKRQLLTFRVQARGRVVATRGLGLKKNSRCEVVVEGSFRRMDFENGDQGGKVDFRILNGSPASSAARAGKPGKKARQAKKPPRSPIEARCRVTVRCGDELERTFDERGRCKYFYPKGLARYSCQACPQGGLHLDLMRKRARLSGTPQAGAAKNSGRARLRLRIQEIEKPDIRP